MAAKSSEPSTGTTTRRRRTVRKSSDDAVTADKETSQDDALDVIFEEPGDEDAAPKRKKATRRRKKATRDTDEAAPAVEESFAPAPAAVDPEPVRAREVEPAERRDEDADERPRRSSGDDDRPRRGRGRGRAPRHTEAETSFEDDDFDRYLEFDGDDEPSVGRSSAVSESREPSDSGDELPRRGRRPARAQQDGDEIDGEAPAASTDDRRPREGDDDDDRPRRRRRRRRRRGGSGQAEGGYQTDRPQYAGNDRGGDRGNDRGADRGSDRGMDRGNDRGADRGGDRGMDRGNDRGADRGSDRGMDRGSDRGADRGSDRGADRGSDRGADRGSDRGGDRGSDRGADRGGDRGMDRGGNRGVRRGRGGRDSNDRIDRGGDRGGDRGRRRQPPPRGERTRSVVPSAEVFEGTMEGVLELHPKGYGFLRSPEKNYVAQESDPFVPSSFVEKAGLREGVLIRGEVGQGVRNQGPRLKDIELVEGRTLEEFQAMKNFDELIPVTPYKHIRLETGVRPATMRVMDLLTPVGKGQRALIVAPPRTGKTMLLQDIADSVSANHPEVHLMVLLIDERPEEVTEMRRRVKGEVIASSMDRDVESHVRMSQLIVERAKRMAEGGKDVFILMDSITRMARAFNKWSGGGASRHAGTMSGGLHVKALDIPKKLFGTARQFENGGSVTIVATALIETGGKMDDVIFQEFKGTGNMELVLSRELADRRIWPAIDITRSGTRHEEKLFKPEEFDSIVMLRRSLISLSPVEAMEMLVRTLDRFPTNTEFLAKVKTIL